MNVQKIESIPQPFSKKVTKVTLRIAIDSNKAIELS